MVSFVASAAPCRLSLMAFKGVFVKDKKVRREHEPVLKAESALREFRARAPPPEKCIARDALDAVYIWGYDRDVEHVGTELNGVR
eukprot:15443355-Alexandrium_andersonii.AAC.1